MSVICCHTPNFLIQLAYRQQPHIADRPLALLGPDERICATSPLASKQGVRLAMRPRQAQTYCPEVALLPLDTATAHAEQAALLSKLAAWELPVEELGWGAAYVDLHAVTKDAVKVQPLAAELGRIVRHTLGEDLTPALGWDSGKFTARAAALRALPGRMRLIDKRAEVPFLSPLSITLLPLAPKVLQELGWLGIRTLGQFAALPGTSVAQRWGKVGRLAQRWAQGRDDRPVRTTVSAVPETLEIDLDPPSNRLPLILAAAQAALEPRLQALADQLAGCKRLRLLLHFVEGAVRTVDIALVEPTSQRATLIATLAHHLAALNWPGELSRLQISLVEIVELPAQQLTLFPALDARPTPLTELVKRFSARYGQVFLQGELDDPLHPVAERRFRWQVLS